MAPGGKNYASVDARFDDLFKRQKEEARAAAIFLQGLGEAPQPAAGDRILTAAERAAVAAKIEQITTQARAYMNDVEANKAAFSSEDATLLNDVTRGLNGAFAAALEIARSGFYNGVPMTLQSLPVAMASVYKGLAEWLVKYAELVRRYNKGGSSAWAGKAASGIAGVAAGLWDFTTAPFRWLKWGLIGVGVLFIAPPIIKIILAARKGGVDAALEESARAAEAGKSVVKSGASLATRAAAAAATGGQSEVARKMLPGMAGLGRAGRRRRRS